MQDYLNIIQAPLFSPTLYTELNAFRKKKKQKNLDF